MPRFVLTSSIETNQPKEVDMIKKSIFTVLAILGFHSVAGAESGSEVDHMSDMVHNSSEAEEKNFAGSFELKYKALSKGATVNIPSYRVRLGWKGDVNEVIKWGVGISSSIEQGFTTHGVNPLNLEQAYISYTPVEGFSIKAGKYGWTPKFHKTGILYDDDLYPMGVLAKYYNRSDVGKVYVKVMAYNLDEKFKGPFSEGTIIKGKLGGKYFLSSDVKGGAYASVQYDGLFKSSEVKPKTLLQVGVNLGVSGMAVPVGAFGVYVTDAQNFSASHSYTGGFYVGNAGTPNSGEANDFGIAVGYYDISSGDFNTSLIDTDYVSDFKKASASDIARAGAAAATTTTTADKARGFAVRAQYNLWDSTNIVAKYAYNSKAAQKDAHNLIGELTFNF